MKTLRVIFNDGFVMIRKVAKDLEHAVLIKELREEGYYNVARIDEVQ